MKLEGKIAVITGASCDIALAIANSFLHEGAKVVICEKLKNEADLVVKSLPVEYQSRAKAVGVDLSSSDSIQDMIVDVVTEWGYIDILINHTHVFPVASVLEMNDEDFDSSILHNVYNALKCCREVTKIMKVHGGCIINTRSVISNFKNRKKNYQPEKKSLLNDITKSLATELGQYHIRVNAVEPVSPTINALTKLYVNVASEDSSYKNGAIINMDGGILM